MDTLEKLSKGLQVSIVDLFMAYKGYTEAEKPSEDGLDFERAVPILALRAGHDLASLPEKKRKDLCQSVESLSRELIQSVITHELKRTSSSSKA